MEGELTQRELDEYFYSVDEVAERFGTSAMHVYRGVHDGTIPHVKFGKRCIRIPAKWVRQMVEQAS